MFIGVMFSCFHEAYTLERRHLISSNKKIEKYWDYLHLLESCKPEYSTYHIPTNKFLNLAYRIATSKQFEYLTMVFIVLNMLEMALHFEDASELYNRILDAFHILFTSFFILESIVKITGLGFMGYFSVGWNRFDFLVVLVSLVELSLFRQEEISISRFSFYKTFQIVRFLRVFRITRLLKIIKSFSGLSRLLQTLKWSSRALLNVFALMFLFIMIFSVMGCFIFKDLEIDYNFDDSIKSDRSLNLINYNEYFNMDNFFSSFLLCFRQATGENWPMIMMELAKCKYNRLN